MPKYIHECLYLNGYQIPSEPTPTRVYRGKNTLIINAMKGDAHTNPLGEKNKHLWLRAETEDSTAQMRLQYVVFGVR